MTIIKSNYHLTPHRTLKVIHTDLGPNLLIYGDCHSIGITVPTADLHAALGVVDARDVRAAEPAAQEYAQKAHEAGEAWAKEHAEHCATTADRDRLQGIVDAVRDVVFDADQILVGPTWTRVREALNPPAFTLPTEAGAGIVAHHVSGDEYELRLFSDGKWYDTTGGDYYPDDLMKPNLWTRHRLIGADE